MRNILAISLLLFSGVASATNNECRGNCGSSPAGANYDQDQGQVQSQGQHQGQLQGQAQSADATAVAGAIAGASANNHNAVGVGVSASNRNDVDVNTSDYNANLNSVNTSDYNANSNRSENANLNSNVALGGEGGKGGSSSQAQTQSSNNANSSNNSSSQSTNLTFEAQKAWRYSNNVSAIAPNIYSSSACTAGGVTGAASALGVGVSLGGAKQDVQCQVRENARILAGLDTALAIEYLCKNAKVDIGATLGDACKYVAPPVVSNPIVVPEPPVVAPPIELVPGDVKGR